MTSKALRTSINNSSAKQQFSFSKADRFHVPKKGTNAFAHINPQLFTTPQSKGRGDGFNSSEHRFFSCRKDNAKTIDGPGKMDRNGGSFTNT